MKKWQSLLNNYLYHNRTVTMNKGSDYWLRISLAHTIIQIKGLLCHSNSMDLTA